MNKLILVGHIGNIKEKESNYGKSLMVSVATNKSYKDEFGDKKTITIWHNVFINNSKQVSSLQSILKKGQLVWVESELSYKKDTFNAILNGKNIQILSSKKDNNKDG